MKKTEAQLAGQIFNFDLFLKDKKIKTKFFGENKKAEESYGTPWEHVTIKKPFEHWIVFAFIWKETKDGFEYWQEINKEFLQFITKLK